MRGTTQQLLATLLLLSIALPSAHALSMTPASKDFIGPVQTTYTVRLAGIEASSVSATITGNATPFISIDRETIPVTDGRAEIAITIAPTRNALPGDYTGGVIIEPAPSPAQNTVQALPAVKHRIGVTVPRQGTHLAARLLSSAGAAKQPVVLTLILENVGTQTIEDAEATLAIDGITFSGQAASIPAGSSKRLTFTWTPRVAGTYTAEARIEFAGRSQALVEEITIGDLEATLGQPVFSGFNLGEVGRIDVPITSQWNQPLRNVHAQYTMRSQGYSESFTGISTDLSPLGEADLTGYWNSAGAPVGEYVLEVEARYGGRTTTQTYPVVVGVDGVGVIQEDSAAALWISIVLTLAVIAVIAVVWKRREP